ncbi:putative elongation factor TS [Trichinella spiralis]|uniref:putative elongation factor TS n=1 Tax=Trichinella spiralis TaxID=6334 RepID=UPI0001EFC054|nr:putative elongation factor TS [Trichinella spiralis]
MLLRNIFRKFSTATGAAVSKEMLMKLQKHWKNSTTTLNSYDHCFHVPASFNKKWLYETAQKEGWQKAAKLATRKACQGLVATFCDKNFGILVEVNCETDFVAKNEQFQNLVRAVTVSCHEQLQHQQSLFPKKESLFNKEEKKLIGKQLCQHIVGMNPTSIGEFDAGSNEKPENTANSKMQNEINESDTEEEDDDDAESFQRTELNNETELMRQSFLLAPNMTVADYAKCKQIVVLDFERFQMLFFIIFTCLHHATAYNITDDMITQWLDSMKKIDKFSSRQFELVLDFQIAADKATGPLDKLIKHLSPEALKLPTVQALFDLVNFYTPKLGIQEDETPEKMQKIEAFLDEVMKSNVIRLLVNHFKLAGVQEVDTIDEFRMWIKKKWFTTYARRNEEGINDSSLFEHFFFGEIVEEEEKVLGLHYWMRYFLLESAGQITYLGYKMKEAESYATVAYKWNGFRKDSGTMLLRTTPEFEIALFSMGYLFRPKRIQFGRCTFAVASHEAEENGIMYYTSTFVKSPKCKKPKA